MPIEALAPLETVEAALLSYTNASGIVTVSPGAPHVPGEGNGLLQTGLWYCIKAQYAPLSRDDTKRVEAITALCRHKTLPLLWRSPFKQNADDDNNHDDYRGFLAACFHAGTHYPAEFVEYAEENAWFVDIAQPTKKRLAYWFARFPGFTAFARACAGHTAMALDEAVLAGAILWAAAFSVGQSDACIKDYCLITVARKSSTAARLASKVWFWRVRRRYAITGQAFAEYFKSRVHPLSMGDWP